MSRFAPFVASDRAGLAALWKACDLSRPWNPAWADIDAIAAHDAAEILVARDEDSVIASVAAGYDGHRGWLYYVAVEPSRRGRGLGREAVAAGEDWLHARGAVKVQLMVRETNDSVLGFYGAQGYEDSHVRVLAKWLDPERDQLYRVGQP